MPPAKRKRKSKHRGNAAGHVEARGRTSRPTPPSVRKEQAKAVAREERQNRPPSWSRSAKTAAVAGVFMFAALYFISPHTQDKKVDGHVVKLHGKDVMTQLSSGRRVLDALLFAVLAMAIYIPAGYYMESAMFKRRMAKKAAA